MPSVPLIFVVCAPSGLRGEANNRKQSEKCLRDEKFTRTAKGRRRVEIEFIVQDNPQVMVMEREARVSAHHSCAEQPVHSPYPLLMKTR
jgi:hypothetical protein